MCQRGKGGEGVEGGSSNAGAQLTTYAYSELLHVAGVVHDVRYQIIFCLSITTHHMTSHHMR